MSLEQSIERLAAAVEALATASGAPRGTAAESAEQAAEQVAEIKKPRGRPKNKPSADSPPVIALPTMPAPIAVHETRTPLTQDQTKELIATFTALGKSGGGKGRDLIAQVMAELGVNTVVAVTGEQFATAIARAKALTK